MDCGFEYFGSLTPAGLPASLGGAGLPGAAGPRARLAQARRAGQVRHYVAQHVDDPELSARDCARALGMSVRSLHLALASSAVTFGGLVTQARLERARELLRQEGAADSVADLAFACGFNSLSSFYRAFRRHFGICPGSMRAGEMRLSS